MDNVSEVPFAEYTTSVKEALDAINAPALLAVHSRFLLKPNLVMASPPPVTTPLEMVRAVIAYIRRVVPQAEIIIAEGCGEASRETTEIFHQLGYTQLAKQYGVALLDLNHAPCRTVANPAGTLFSEFLLADVAFTHCIVSLPMLKAHSYATITGTLKNMMGFLPPSRYSGSGGTWKKAVFHTHMHKSLQELNAILLPHISIMDASVGLSRFHLGGPTCNPPVNRILASADAYALDRRAAELLGFDWREIDHLTPLA